MMSEFTSRVSAAIVANRERFLRMVDAALNARDDERACAEIESAARFAALCGTGVYASSALERRLRGIAVAISCGSGDGREVSGTLLVATELYAVGGHTKVLERFGQMLAASCERVSLFISSPTNVFVPESLRESVRKSGGEIMAPDDSSRCERARRLRTCALAFRRVVLMTHPEDVVPVLAFGTDAFPRPVFAYGHTNHTFWLGVSVVDRLLEINDWGRDIATRLRGIARDRISVVGLPVERLKTGPSTTDRAVLLEKFGIPAEGPLVVTAASPRKFRTVGCLDFAEILEGVLSDPKSPTFAIVGPDDASTPEWDCLRRKHLGRIVCTGPVGYSDLLACYAAADVVVDSYPLNGWTSLVDAISVGAAVVCPQGAMGLMDYLVDSPAYACDAASAVVKVSALLSDPSLRLENSSEMRRRMAQSTDYESVKDRLVVALNQTTSHLVHEFSERINEEPTIQDMAIYAMTMRRKKKFAIPGFELFSVREGATKCHELSLLGGRFIWRF